MSKGNLRLSEFLKVQYDRVFFDIFKALGLFIQFNVKLYEHYI